jgi:alpha-beta hydrolase superfamily lysophospholipase
MPYQETVVRRDQHRIHVRDYPGAGPPIILMHGFPDNLHLYDRLVPYLSPPRRVVLFDFLGWGNSDKPSGYPYTTANQVGDLDAVITQLGLRIETLCEPLDRKVLVSAALATVIRDRTRLEPLGAHVLRGVREAKEIFALQF